MGVWTLLAKNMFDCICISRHLDALKTCTDVWTRYGASRRFSPLLWMASGSWIGIWMLLFRSPYMYVCLYTCMARGHFCFCTLWWCLDALLQVTHYMIKLSSRPTNNKCICLGNVMIIIFKNIFIQHIPSV